MSPHKRNGIHQLYVPRQVGEALERSTGTKDPKVYRGMKRLVEQLHDTHRWALLNALTDKVPGQRAPRLTLRRLYASHTSNRLDALELELSASALAPHVKAYLKDCKTRGLAPRNVENIKRQLESFLKTATTTADLTTATVQGWLGDLTTTPGTRRQYLYAVTGLTRYLCDMGVLKDYPLGRVRTPKKNAARMTYTDAATDERIVQAASPKYRALFAFIKATGADVTTAINLRREDVSNEWTVRLKGTKTAQRDVHGAIIEPWAWGYLRPALIHALPFAKVFPGLTRHGASQHHKRCCEALQIDGYTLRDSRHSVAVRMAKQGYNIHQIAEQLGNSPEICAKVYTQHIPDMQRKATPDATSTGLRISDAG